MIRILFACIIVFFAATLLTYYFLKSWGLNNSATAYIALLINLVTFIIALLGHKLNNLE